MPNCGVLYVKPTGESELFGFDFNTPMGGEENTKIKFETDPVRLSVPLTLIPKFLKVNWGIHDPKQDWYPLVATWKLRTIKTKIHTIWGNININIKLPVPTQALNEIYLDEIDLADIPLFTIPSFKFNLDVSIGGLFTLNSHFGVIATGISGMLLAADTQQLIKNIDGENAPDMNKMSNSEVNTYLASITAETAFAPVLGYLVRDCISVSYTIKKLFGSGYIDMNEFKLEFGDLKIVIPKFRMAITVPDVLANNPIEVEVGRDRSLKVSILLFTINGNFIQDIINGIQNTLAIVKDDIKNEKIYNVTKLQEALDFLIDKNNVHISSDWVKNHLGLRSEYKFYFVLCPSGMRPSPDSPYPPTPFFIKIEFIIHFNPYKILETMLDFDEILTEAISDAIIYIAHKYGYSKETRHVFEKQNKSAIKSITKDIEKGIKDIKKSLNTKMINTERTVMGSSNIPILIA
jgi:hypothetical protein